MTSQPQDGAPGRHPHPGPAPPTSTWRWPSTWPVPGTTRCSPPSRGSRPPRSIPAAIELPLLHLAAGWVQAGRGATEEAERHARLAEEAAASLDYGQERLYAAMARALVCQASGDYLGMADALGLLAGQLGPGRPQPGVRGPVATAAGRGPGRLGAQSEQAAAALERLQAEEQSGRLPAAGPGLAGRMAGGAARGHPTQARRIYQTWRGHRQHGKPGSHGPVVAGPRPAPAADGPAAPGGRAPAAGERLVPGPARAAPSSPGPKRNWLRADCLRRPLSGALHWR